eukprot:jgi/Phyca11/543299/estExt2_Genewise1Plus.C_PHYCAscaffold_110514
MLNVQPGRALLSHIVICDGITAEDKEKWRRFQEVEQRKAEAARLARRSSAKRARRSSNEGDDDRYSLEHGDLPPELDIKTFHLIIAKFFYAANIPFRVVDNPAFHRLCLEGRPDHLSVPTRASLSGALLDKVYTQERRETLGVLKEETYVVMETDGWTNIRDEHIVIDEVEDLIGKKKIVAVTTDSPSTMRRAMDILEEKRPWILTSGCGAHAMNLLLKDVMGIPFFSKVLGKARDMTKFIKKRRALLKRFRNTQAEYTQASHRSFSRSLTTPVVTHVFSNKTFMTRFKGQTQKSKLRLSRITEYVEDLAFWRKLRRCIKLVNPIIGCIAAFESDNCSLSVIYSAFAKLQREPMYADRRRGAVPAGVPAGVRTKIRRLVEQRWNFIHTDAMGVAFLLDQTQSTDDFVMDDLDDTLRDLENIAVRFNYEREDITRLRDEIGRFIAMKESWSPEARAQHSRYSPASWWGAHIKKFPMTAKIALKVFCISTSSAAAERSWSTHDYIHCKRRNRLSLDTVMKLVSIYTNMGDKRPTDSTLFRTPWLDRRASNDDEESEDMAAEDFVEEEAAVAEQLDFDADSDSDDEMERQSLSDSDSDTSSTDSSD